MLGVTWKAPPSMDMVGEQSQCRTLTNAQCRKIQEGLNKNVEGKCSTEEAKCIKESFKVGVQRMGRGTQTLDIRRLQRIH
jgi:hypothetical protein